MSSKRRKILYLVQDLFVILLTTLIIKMANPGTKALAIFGCVLAIVVIALSVAIFFLEKDGENTL